MRASDAPAPGQRTAELLALREQYIPKGVANASHVFTERASGATLLDIEGNRYIDFAGGIGVLNVGANHPEVVQAIKEQADRVLHTCFNVTMTEPYVRVAERLAQLTPGRFPKKTFLANSGAEAVENAVKIARKFTGRPAIMVLGNSFHGRTLLAMTMTTKVAPYKAGFGPFAPEVYRGPFPYPYRSPYADPGEGARACLEDIERMIRVDIGADKLAAIVAEPVQGEGGFIPAPPTFFPGLAALCRKYGILLIADEIQTGFYRTGLRFAVDHWGVEPDLILSAKSLAGGMPLSAVTGRAEVMDSVHVGGLGGTYTGNPLACAAALKVMEIMERDDYAGMARRIGEVVQARFGAWRDRYPLVGDVRGLGAMVALELVTDRVTKEPAPAHTDRVVNRALELGLVVLKSGIYTNVIRFLAPLSISAADLDTGLQWLEQALSEVQDTAAR